MRKQLKTSRLCGNELVPGLSKNIISDYIEVTQHLNQIEKPITEKVLLNRERLSNNNEFVLQFTFDMQ